MIKHIKDRYITSPGDQGDGLTLCDGNHYVIDNCIIDLTYHNLDDIDEAIGVTWGSSAEISNCTFRGAGKLILCGSGDKDKLHLEKDKTVTFRRCIFENFSRRGPEVQDGMHVFLEECLIRDWGQPDRFTVRSFGAWAHGEGSSIHATKCVFLQEHFYTRNFFKDLIGHIGQAVNDGGFWRFFTKEAWRPGTKRGLTATVGGYVEAINCYASKGVVLENRTDKMSEEDAYILTSMLLTEHTTRSQKLLLY